MIKINELRFGNWLEMYNPMSGEFTKHQYNVSDNYLDKTKRNSFTCTWTIVHDLIIINIHKRRPRLNLYRNQTDEEIVGTYNLPSINPNAADNRRK